MKKTILLGLLLAAPAFSAEGRLPSDAVGLSKISDIKLTRVITPRPRSIPPGRIIELVSVGQFTAALSGCEDQLGPVATRHELLPNGKLAVYVSAINIHTKRSMSARCLVAPTAKFTLTLGMGFIDEKNVEVIVLN